MGKLFPKVYNINRRDEVPSGAVFVGRPTKWGNPFVLGLHGDRQQCVEWYADYLANNKHLLESLHELKGRDLVCYCAPKRCHADILLELANRG